ncbi:MAG: acyl-CoA dehydratase activase [Desulfobacterales bacterium]|nr:acyl-CoA dehydratase activase [Desulfobacterales bacterium]
MGPVFVGIDVGSSRTKAAILDAHKTLAGRAEIKSGTDFTAAADLCLRSALAMGGLSENEIAFTVATGYGRKNVSFARQTKTEISCHAKGAYHYFPRAITIIDIGGQDNKIIKVNEDGLRLSFKMNRKCAAGTGAFLEEMAARLDLSLDQLDSLARASQDMVELGSFCTVFSGTEVLEKIRSGKKVPDIVKGLFFSVIKRVMEMDSLGEHVLASGGVVAYNPFLIQMFEETIGRKVLVPPYPQLTGAVGAAIYAMDRGE